jgi:hypothetical protein
MMFASLAWKLQSNAPFEPFGALPANPETTLDRAVCFCTWFHYRQKLPNRMIVCFCDNTLLRITWFQEWDCDRLHKRVFLYT